MQAGPYTLDIIQCSLTGLVYDSMAFVGELSPACYINVLYCVKAVAQSAIISNVQECAPLVLVR